MAERSRLNTFRVYWLVFFVCFSLQNGAEALRPSNLEKVRHHEIVTVVEHTTSLFEAGERERHPHTAYLEFQAFDQSFHLVLKKNEGLVSANYKTYSTDAAGNLIAHEFDRAKMCYYLGEVRGQPTSNVAVSTCGGLKGMIAAYGEQYFIEPMDTEGVQLEEMTPVELFSRRHAVYKLSDVDTMAFHNRKCGNHHGDHMNYDGAANISDSAFLQEIQEYSLSEKNAPRISLQQTTQKYTEMYIFNDHSRFRGFSSQEACETNTLELMNVVSAKYQLNTFSDPVQVSLVGQVTFPIQDPWTLRTLSDGVSVSPEEMLTDFRNYRAQISGSLTRHDVAHVLSHLNFDGFTIGLAFVGTMCRDPSRTVGVNMVTFTDAYDASIVAHELGHNFGMRHDDDTNGCPSTGFIMASSGNPNLLPPTQFSSCSRLVMNSYLDSVFSTCLNDQPSAVVGNSICGNGIREAGEQCDCGSNDCSELDDCCDGRFCILKIEARCSTSDACCSATCNFLPTGTLCRSSANSCDIGPEFCSGAAAECPQNDFFTAGRSCFDNGDGLCFDQTCQTYGDSCPSDQNVASPCSCTSLPDGTPCGIQNDIPHQCSNNVCVPSSQIVESVWYSSLWSSCSLPCRDSFGTAGKQSRTVTCRQGGQTVSDSLCEATDVAQPHIERECNDFMCNACAGQFCNQHGECTDFDTGICTCFDGHGGNSCQFAPTIEIVSTSLSSSPIIPGQSVDFMFETTGEIREIVAVLNSSALGRWNRYISEPPTPISIAIQLLQVDEGPQYNTSFQWTVDADVGYPAGSYSVSFVFDNELSTSSDPFIFGCVDSACGNGACGADLRCQCEAGFTGATCANDACEDMACGANSNGCSLGQCSCINGFSGKLCDIPSGCAVTESPCQNSARIISCSGSSVVCACNDGFGGELCQTCDLCSAGGGSPNADCSECLGCPDNRGGKTCDLEPVEFMIRLNNVNLVEATGEELSTSFRAAFVRDVAFTLGLPRTSVRVSRVDASGEGGVTVRFFVFRRSNEGLLLDATFTNSLLFQLREPH
eukprot:233518_1